MQSKELWTVEHAARHWGVSVSRARGILSTRHIRRVSGYPAEAIRAVMLRQGARTDLTAPGHVPAAAHALSLADTAAAILGFDDDQTRLRIFFEFIRGAHETGRAALNLIADEPALTNDDRFDALLAGAAEYLCARWARPGPLWTIAADRFLHRAWWVGDLPSARAQA